MAASINQILSQSQAAGVTRLVTGVAFGLAITLSLFWVMQYLIATADRSLNKDDAGAMLGWASGTNLRQFLDGFARLVGRQSGQARRRQAARIKTHRATRG